MRILLLSCSTGEGHNSACAALAEEWKARGVACTMLDPISFQSDRTARIVAQLYVKMAVRTPRLFGLLYRAGMAISSDRHKSVVYLANMPYARKLQQYIVNGGFDAVITTHLYPAEALTRLLRQGELQVPCYGVCTDYCCIPFWEETELDGYFIPDETLAGEFIARGMKAEKLISTGIPVSRNVNAARAMGKKEARRQLSLDAEERLLLLMGGSMGSGNLCAVVRELLKQTGIDTKVAVLCGNNDRLRRRMERTFGRTGRVTALPYTRQAALWMRACDVLLTKPGGLTSTEAGVMGVPLVHTKPIPGCETSNARFFARLGLAVFAPTPAKMGAAAQNLLNNELAGRAMRDCQRMRMHPEAARDICHWVLAHSAAGENSNVR